MTTLSSLPEIKPGDVIAGRFRIVELVGKGGFSVVYRAYQEHMNRFVAIKVLKPEISDDEQIVERFRREALFASHLSHPNTITLFDYGYTDGGLFYIAMEYLDGRDLGQVIRSNGRLSLPRVWSILVQACQSLAEAHKLSLIHRDLKPENIFLVEIDGTEQVKVLDFGLSKALRSLTDSQSGMMTPLTQDGKVFGTPMYMAPEQAMDNPISPAVDVYSLGHIAWEMITGRPCYADQSNPMDIMLRQIYDGPLTLPEPWEDSPFADLIFDATRKAPEDRLRTAGAMLQKLRGQAFERYRQGELSAPPTVPEDPVDLESGSDSPTGTELRGYLDQLLGVLDEVRRESKMQLVLLAGPAGGGRDKVLDEFVSRCQGTETEVIHRPDPTRESDEHALGLRADLADLSDRNSREVSGLSDLLDVQTPIPEAWLDEGGQRDSAIFGRLADRRASLLSRCGDIFRRGTQDGPLVWAIENLEDIDAFSLAFLNWFFQDLQTDPAPMMIVATLDRQGMMRRTGMLRYTQAILGAGAPHARQIEVRPAFEPASIEQLLELSSASGSSGEGLDAISEPGEAGGLGAESSVIPLPTDGEEFFDQLLSFLAQFGDEVPRPLFERVLQWREDMPMAAIDRVLDWAERFGIVHADEDAVGFTKHSFARTLRKRWHRLHPDASDFHRRAADTLLDYYDPLPRPLVDIVVEHYLSAEEFGRAARLLFETGDRAFKALNLDEAREQLMHLQRIMQSHPESMQEGDEPGVEPVEVWLRLGEVHGALEEHGAAEDALRHAAARARGSKPRMEARALKLLGDLQSARGNSRRAADFYRDARSRYEHADASLAAAAVNTLLGSAQLRDGRPQDAVETLNRAHHVIRDSDSRLLEARTCFRLGRAYIHLADFQRAGRALQHAFGSFEELDRRDEAVRCLTTLGEALLGLGRMEDAHSSFQSALDRVDSLTLGLTDGPLLGLVRALAALRRFEEAADWLREALQKAVQSSDRRRHALLHLYRGDLHVAAGEWDQALHHYEELRRRSRDIGHTELYLEALVRQGVTHFDAGASGEAWDELERAMSFADKFGDDDTHLGLRARALYLQSVDCQFQYGVQGMRALLEDATTPHARLACQLGLADAACAAGEFDEARERLQTFRLEAARIGEFSVLLPVHRRLAWLDTPAEERSRETTSGWRGVTLGALFPPEVGPRRHAYLPKK